jgi:hypothetical protein
MFKSDLSGKDFTEDQKVKADAIRSGVFEKIKESHPHFNELLPLSIGVESIP